MPNNKSVCLLPRLTDQRGGVAVHVNKLAQHLERRGWQIVAQPDGQALVHCHAMERSPQVDVTTNHGIYPLRDNMPQWQVNANQQIFENLRLGRQVVAVSHWTARQWADLIGRRPGDGTTHVIPNGIDPEEWSDVPTGIWRGKLGIGSRPLVLWGKMGLSDVLDPTPALDLALRRPDLAVVMPLDKRLLPTAPANVYCVGPQPFPAMQALLADCDVYLATVQENHSIQLLEALALGKPVLGYAWGGTWETVAGKECAVMVRPGDLDGLSAGLETVLADDGSMGEAGKALVADRYTWERQIMHLESVYAQAQAQRKREQDPGRPVCSIVIPVYNKTPYVAEAIKSALAQTAAPTYEVIVIDDGSSDDSLAVARKAVSDARSQVPVQVLTQENAGVAAARNRGISLARGRYIACLDADDRIDPLFLSRLSAALEADPGLGIAYSDMQVFGVNQATVRTSEYDFERLKRGNFIPCCNLFRRSAWERAGGYKDINPSWEDYELWLNMGKLGWPGRRVPGPLFHYRKLDRQGRDYESHGLEWRLRAIVNSHHRDLYPPMVSVVIPCYEQSRFLRDAIDSVLGQTFPDLEIVVVDDGNEPEEASAIGEIVDEYETVRLLTLPANGGLANARNVGIRAAQGQWIVPLDADDLIEPAFIEAMLAAVELDPRRFGYSDSVLWWPEDVPAPAGNDRLAPEPDTRRSGHTQALTASEYSFPELLRRITWPCTVLYHRTAWEQVGGYKNAMSEAGGWEDWEFAISLSEIGICGVRVAKPLFVYRQHSASQMRNTAQNRKPALQEAIRRLHPAVYRGEFPVGCCGRSTSSQPAATSRTATYPNSVNGSSETTLVRYVGAQMGSKLYVGPSGRSYRFGMAEPLQDVLAVDVDWFRERPDFVTVMA